MGNFMPTTAINFFLVNSNRQMKFIILYNKLNVTGGVTMSNTKPEGLFGGQNFIQELKEFRGQRVNVEFECGKIAKRVTGGTLVEVGSDFIQLNGKINIIYIVPGMAQPIVKNASIIVIPINRVCAVEKP